MLDEVDGKLDRLTALDLRSLAIHELARWERNQVWDEHALTVHVDGDLLLSQSSSVTGAHRIARVDVRAPEEGLQVYLDRGILVAPPLVDGAGATLVVRETAASKELRVNRIRRMEFPERLDWYGLVLGP